MINGFTGMAVMLLDVLTGVDRIKICTSYYLDNQPYQTIPARIEDFEQCQPKYIELDGWTEDITNVKSFEELPENAKAYLQTLEELVGIPIVLFSVGPDRNQTIIQQSSLNSKRKTQVFLLIYLKSSGLAMNSIFSLVTGWTNSK